MIDLLMSFGLHERYRSNPTLRKFQAILKAGKLQAGFRFINLIPESGKILVKAMKEL